MNRLTRAFAVVVAAGLVVPVWASPAAAESATEPASHGAYFYAQGISKPDASPQAPPNLTNEADGVAPGKLPVAAKGGQKDKISFLLFGLTSAPVGAEISKATLTLPLVPNSPQNVSIAADPVKVRACPAGPEGFFGEDGVDMKLAPQQLCEQLAAPATASEDQKSYVFDVTNIAKLWATANDGIALVPADGAQTTNFQVVFESADLAQLTYEYTASEEASFDLEDLAAFETGATTTTPDLSVGSTPSFDAGSGTTSLGGSGADFSAGTAPLTGAPVGPSAPLPETAGEEPLIAARQAAGGGPAEVLSPTVGFWLMGLVLAGGLAFLSLVMGDPRGATPAAAKPSRLSQALTRPGTSSSLFAKPTS